MDNYAAVGRIEGSIDRQAEAVLAELERANRIDRLVLKRVMKALTDLDRHDWATRRLQRRSELIVLVRHARVSEEAGIAVALDRVLSRLKAEDASFLQLGPEDDREVDIGYEALIRSWTRLSGENPDVRTGWPREEHDDGEQWRDTLRADTGSPSSATRSVPSPVGSTRMSRPSSLTVCSCGFNAAAAARRSSTSCVSSIMPRRHALARALEPATNLPSVSAVSVG